MKILAIERERSGATPDQFQPHLRPEAARVWELYQADVIREMYFDRDCHAAVLMLECPSVEQAREILGTLPLVREALITFDLIPLVPYSGFSRLFMFALSSSTTYGIPQQALLILMPRLATGRAANLLNGGTPWF